MARGDAQSLDDVILVVVLCFLILFIGVSVASSTLDSTGADGPDESETVLLKGAGETVTLGDRIGEDETVYNSRGYAVELAGTGDSYVQSQESIELATDDTWTVSTWASLSPQASIQNRALLSVNGRLVITYYPMQGNWSAWYYDEGSTNSYRVNVSAENVMGEMQNVMVRSNGTHLAIYQNNTRGDVKDITGEQITEAPLSMANWHGRMDEVRVFDDALDDANRSAVVNSPVAPRKGTNRTARIMFDEPSADRQLLFFATGGVTQSNVSFAAGLDGAVMDGQSIYNDITGATDYQWDVVGPKIRPVSGGELDGAPVAYVDYSASSELDTFVDDFRDGIVLAGLIPVVVILGFIAYRLQGTRRR